MRDELQWCSRDITDSKLGDRGRRVPDGLRGSIRERGDGMSEELSLSLTERVGVGHLATQDSTVANEA